jgi:hypothetical protein
VSIVGNTFVVNQTISVPELSPVVQSTTVLFGMAAIIILRHDKHMRKSARNRPGNTTTTWFRPNGRQRFQELFENNALIRKCIVILFIFL